MNNNTFEFRSNPHADLLTFDTIDVAIGEPEPVTYVLGQTTAPQAYDGFGTFSPFQTDDVRVVLVRKEHFNWQFSRNASGLFYITPYNNREGIIDLLRKRITGQPV